MTSEFIVAVNCMVFLSRYGKATSEEMAKEACTNASRVRRVMAMMKKGALICTKEGARGGYILCKPPEEVTLGEIFALTFGYAYTYKSRQGTIDQECMECSGMDAVMEEIHKGMEEKCRQYLDTITLRDILKSLLEKNKR
jgi:Rrf2 family protein